MKKNKAFVVGKCSPCALTSLLLDGVMLKRRKEGGAASGLMEPDGFPVSTLPEAS